MQGLNPIGQKLQNMAARARSKTPKNKFLQTRINTRFNTHTNKENDSLYANSTRIEKALWKSSWPKIQPGLKDNNTEEDLKQCMRDN
jgi:hypothetical protein